MPWRTGALVALLCAVLLTGGYAAATSNADFGAYNRGWDGTSDLRQVASDAGATPTVVRDTDEYAGVPANDTVAVVLSPDQPYTDAEQRALRQFVADGGTLVVAGDRDGEANALLAALGARTRLDGRALRDPRHYERGPALPRLTNVTEGPWTTGVETLVFNYGTALAPAGGRVLATSSPDAYLDANTNGTLDASDPVGRHPVVATESVQAGRVVVVADASLFVNAMLERGDNRRFATALFDHHRHALLDYSHTAALPLAVSALYALRDSALGQLAVALAALAVVAAWPYRRRVSDALARSAPTETDTPPRLDAEAIDAYLAREHPDWDAERRARVVQGVITRRRESPRDD
ncbi:DUF4350 domain-containing protein (plasmid) [Halarchaeum sp. CBA1220]|uniref:DUF4350 domain-containing protein n=1 Tax=Halarchaeum sp. CBA1220 TaxID=1853682 RepID=UPI001314B212|nr:DUF4350 domain-containing protein [Halarchaeum sp. CBA1220]QLC35133.1 DUF4350 domain-containing protein [Halarchaeum sp. CBA1220]